MFIKNYANADSGLAYLYIDVYNNSDNEMKLPNAGDEYTTSDTFSGTESDIAKQLSQEAQRQEDNYTWESKEIAGHNGMLIKMNPYAGEKTADYEYDYIEGDKYIKIYVTDQSILNEILSK